MLSFSLVAEALTGLIYHRPSGENSNFQFSADTSWCAKWRIKLNPEKPKVIIFSKSQTAVRAEPSYYPQMKFLRITFDNRMTFTKQLEEILKHCNQNFHRLRILVNKEWGPSPETITQIYKQCVRPIFKYGIVSTVTVSETVITKIQRVQNSFIRLALCLPKYVLACLLHEASGLPYVRERLITVGQNHLARMHANPLVEHTINCNSARTNIAWDKYKTPIFIPKPPDLSTNNDNKMQRNQVASFNVQPLTLRVVVQPTHGHIWHSPWTLNQSQHGYLFIVFLYATTILQWLDHAKAISLSHITTDNNCLFAIAIAYISKCVCK